ncbi:HD-GYP domain-containing protein [Halopseudomonas xiamenensis]|uniref:HD-GYP domain-containing protein n=1 Tax=Halopseudomonas xiamenensis TaxID=157792 RepID=UPI0016241C5E|nr:DUF3391 domain-containing protein [Halopseudomonas xiamenensis]
MLKPIAVSDLVCGMYIHSLSGSWLQHPFWKNSFLLDAEEDLLRPKQSGIRDVVIDLSKGLDVPAKAASQAAVSAPASGERKRRELAGSQQTSLEDELLLAQRICLRSKHAVMAMFADARMGKIVDTSQVPELVQEIASSIQRHPHALINLARLKNSDEYTYMHSVAVCALMIALARQLGLDNEQVREAGIAGMLHDIGKMAIPEEVLNKPGRLNPAEALGRMAQWQGHFDDEIFQAFVKAVGIYPVGSLVRLDSGRIGVVIEQAPGSLLKPRVKVFFSQLLRQAIPLEIIDLSQPGCSDRIVAREPMGKWSSRNIDALTVELPLGNRP